MYVDLMNLTFDPLMVQILCEHHLFYSRQRLHRSWRSYGHWLFCYGTFLVSQLYGLIIIYLHKKRLAIHN